MNYDLNYGDKKSNRYIFIKSKLQPQIRSGLNFVFLPSDPDKLVDQLKLLYFEKVGGNDIPMLSEQIIANADKLFITVPKHYNKSTPKYAKHLRYYFSLKSYLNLKIVYK